MPVPVFILAPGRSFTSVLCAALGQHPQLFGFPELNLSIAPTVGQWLRLTGGLHRALRPGLLRAIAILRHGEETDETVTEVQRWLRQNPELPTATLYRMIREAVAPRAPVDKSPTSVMNATTLENLLVLAPDARFIHVTRHPFSACSSMANTDWYRLALETLSQDAQDTRFEPPVFDVQVHWLQSHARILEFKPNVPPERWLHVRGEEVLAEPDIHFPRICRWLGIDDGADAIRCMKRPEHSPFARPGPKIAGGGNDPGFVESPILRPYRIRPSPLQGPLPWRTDGEGFLPETRRLAEIFGYAHDARPPHRESEAPAEKTPALVAIEPEDDGSPTAHGDLVNSGLSRVPPLRSLTEVHHVPYPINGAMELGTCTGGRLAIAAFDGTREPAIVAFDLEEGERLWQTPRDVLAAVSESPGRRIGGLLLATLRFKDASVSRRIFAANAKEVVCFAEDGRILWRRPGTAIMGNTGEPMGSPCFLRPTRDRCIVFATDNGSIVKLDALTGEPVDLYRLGDVALVDGVAVEGRFRVTKPGVLIGDDLYLDAAFTREEEAAGPRGAPVFLLKIRVSGSEDGGDRRLGRLARIDASGGAPDRFALRAPVGAQASAPTGMRRSDGVPVIVAAHVPGGMRGKGAGPGVVRAVADADGGLCEQWSMPVEGVAGPGLRAGSACDPDSGLYILAFRNRMRLVRDAASRSGHVAPDLEVRALDLLDATLRAGAVSADFSSALALARDPENGTLVCHAGIRVLTGWASRPFTVLTAVDISEGAAGLAARLLWSGPLVVDGEGKPMPSVSCAQPALFSWRAGSEVRTGILMGSVDTGVSFFR